MRHDLRPYSGRDCGIRLAAPDHRTERKRTTDDTAASMVVRNAELVRRMQRLSPVLVEMASDLAGARRESSALRRENEQLHARLTRLERRFAAVRGRGMLASTPERR
jgi:hypothetical protein